ncbi:tetratricopeptide repeat protein [Beggiatoa alba]|nr:tetratricopeptide repeat protein [Beggiatoa alba]
MCSLIVVMGFLMVATAFAGSAKENFELGIKTATSGDNTAALQYFKKAKQAGLNSAALKYNLAVSYYKLQQYENSRKIFSELTDIATFEQLAYFNLGLVANKQKDEAAAIRWFQRAHRNLSNEKIRSLAAVALERLGVSARNLRRTVSDWTGAVSSALVYDSNVALVNEDLLGVTSESDTAVDLSVTAGRWLKGNINSGVRLRLSARLRKYSKLSQSDDSQLSVRVLRYDRLGDWKLRLGGSWDEIYYNGSEYQRVVSADVRGRTVLSSGNQLRLRYKLSRIQATDSVFDYLDGWRQQFRMGLQQRREASKFRYYYQLELNHRDDRIGTIDPFISYSPTRHTLRATGWWRLASRWYLRLDARFRYSDYNDDNIQVGNITEHRQDSQGRLSARISRKFDRRWELHAQYIGTNNDSSVDRRSYDRSIAKVGVSWSF